MNVKNDVIFEPRAVGKRLRKQKSDLNTKCKQYIKNMIEYQHELVRNVFNYKRGANVQTPVAFAHIIQNIQNQQNIQSNSLVDITPLEAFAMIENMFDNIMSQSTYCKPNLLFKILYYFYMSPRDLIIVKAF